MPEPELVVFEGEGGDGVGAAEVEEKEGRPEGLEDVGLVLPEEGLGGVRAVVVGVVVLAAGDVADGEVGGPVGEQVGRPEQEDDELIRGPLPQRRRQNQKCL